ncbi:hypothetical protein ACFW6C_07380 [Streptomyces fungicidicus]|uniref:hypothetical protein n=1 Tax=Streptomyces fungicidicus TaxID=68203 RepID=UPI003699D2CC
MTNKVEKLVAGLTPHMVEAVKGAARNPGGGIGRRNLGNGGGTYGALGRRDIIAPGADGWYALTELGWSVAEALGMEIPEGAVEEAREHAERVKYHRAQKAWEDSLEADEVDEAAVDSAKQNAFDTVREEGLEPYSTRWYEVAYSTYHYWVDQNEGERRVDQEMADNKEVPVETQEEAVEAQELIIPKGIRFDTGEAGREASDAYKALMAERMAVQVEDVKKGDHVRITPTAPWLPITADAHASHMRGHVYLMSGQYVVTRPIGAKVLRHNKEECARVMYEVADRYPGATVELPEVQEEGQEAQLQAGDTVEYVGNLGILLGKRGTILEVYTQALAGLGAWCAVTLEDGSEARVPEGALRLVTEGISVARTFTDGEGGTFTLEVNGATVTVKDVTEEGEEATATTFASVEEAEAFVAATVAELAVDGWAEQSE